MPSSSTPWERPALRRRPSPDEILAAALRLDVNAVEELAVVGDTVGDLVAGTRAGASVVAGVIGGASDADEAGERAAHASAVERRGPRDRAPLSLRP